MIEPEIIKLKKEIHHLKEQNAELQEELEDKNTRLGQLETEHFKIKNETLLLNKTKLNQHKEIIKLNVEKALEKHMSDMTFLEAKVDELSKKCVYLEQEKINLEEHQKDLQLQNNQLKKQLIEFGTKHEATDFINNIRVREDALIKKEQEYQKIVLQWNELCDKMENILSENRLLRELANVPANFGIKIEEIKLGDRMKIEDYKAKIRILQKEVDDLETERAQLKHRLIFLSNAVEIQQPPFNLLTSEQKVVIAVYAQALYEGKEFIVPERYELLKEIQNLKNKIELLEDQNSKLRIEGNYRIYGVYGEKGKSGPTGDNISELIKALRDENAELKQLLKNSLDKFSDFNFQALAMTRSDGQFPKENVPTTEMNYLQLPPMPLIDQKNIDNTGYGYSYRLNSKFKIDTDQIHKLFGIALNDNDVDDLKKESASLQCQMIELLEIMFRMKSQDEMLNENLEKMYNKLESLVLMQNEIIERFIFERKQYRDEVAKHSKTNSNLFDEVNSIKRRNKALEDTITLIESKNLSQIEHKAIDKMKENSILEINYLQVSRKYESLVEEEKKLRSHHEEMEKNTIEKDSHLETTIAKLKEWKSLLMFYLKFLMKKLKKSVAKDEFEKILEENRYLREKYNEVILRDVSITKQISIAETLRLRLKEMENNFYESEEMKIDTEIELNIVKKRLQDVDPEYHLQQKVFRKFVSKLNEIKMGFSEIQRVFDENNNGIISRDEFTMALKLLQMKEFLENQKEFDILMRCLHCDEENKIDTRFFIRMLERSGIEGIEEKNQGQKLLETFIEGIKNSGQSLKSVFECFDSSGDGIISREEFKFALNQLKFTVNDDMLNKLIILINGGEENNVDMSTQLSSINYNQFCDLFDQRSRFISLKNRRNTQIKQALKIDWKTNLLSLIVDGIKKNNLSYAQAFQYLDSSKSGKLNPTDISNFLKMIGVDISKEDVGSLFKMLDVNNDGDVVLDEFINVLRDCEGKIETFKSMTNLHMAGDDNKSIHKGDMNANALVKNLSQNAGLDESVITNVDINRRFTLLLEKEKFYNYKIEQLRKRCEESEKMNKETSEHLEDYVKKHADMINKYFFAIDELQKLKAFYDTSGLKREDLHLIEQENDSFAREVTVLRIGMNTFKDLYQSSTRQVKMITLHNQKHLDEIDTYKKAVKELQGESNQNALIGKLYYSLLISRWREASSLRKYDDFVADFSSLKEDNFQLETQNKGLTKDITELQAAFHEKIIENIRITDELDNYTKGLVFGQLNVTDGNNRINPIEELQDLVKTLSADKTDITGKLIALKKEHVNLLNENDELKNKIDYSEALANRIKFNSRDEYSKKLIELCEEISKLRLGSSILNRENAFLKENELHLQRLNDGLTKSIKDLEEKNAEWESRFRKMEEVYRSKDEERQKKLFGQLKNLQFSDPTSIGAIVSNQVKSNIGSITGKDQISTDRKVYNDYESKIKELNEIITIKTEEINRLTNLLNDNAQMMKDSNSVNIPNLVGKTGYDIIKDDETQIIAQTAHKTIKTLQDMLTTKNDTIKRKDETIENLHKDLIQLKEHYLNVIATLQDQIRLDHDSTMKKLRNVIDMTNNNLLVKLSRNELSLMTLSDIEKLLEDKDNAIKALAGELKCTKEENEVNYAKINELNKRINELTINFNEEKLKSGVISQNSEINQLKKMLKEKSNLIDEERERIKLLKEEFGRKLEDRTLFDDQLLKSSVYIPDRLVDNNEKAQSFKMIQSLRNQIHKLKDEKEKLNKAIEEMKKSVDDNAKRAENVKKENRMILDTQKKDTETISRLKKEKDQLNAKIDKLKEENEQLRKTINDQLLSMAGQGGFGGPGGFGPNLGTSTYPLQTQTQMQSNIPIGKTQQVQDKVQQKASSVSSSGMLKMSSKEEKKQALLVKEPVVMINVLSKPMEENTTISDDVITRLIYFCLKKNLNMNRHLQRYDITKLGKISKGDFTKAIEELKLGFIDYEISKLIEICNPVENFIEIKAFVEMMMQKDKNYEILIKDQEPSQIGLMKKSASKKYSPFENKSFNINY